MAGVLPDPSNGGLITRNESGVALNPPNVSNAYVPGEDFTFTCPPTALPGDCTGRITPAQINALVSELICFAERLKPDAVWDCDEVCNISNIFLLWEAAHFNGDGVTIEGNGAVATPFTIIPEGVSAAVISTDADNNLVLGSDNLLFLAAIAGEAAGAAPPETSDPETPTTHFGDNTAYLGRPVRWIDLTIPGVAGTVRIPSYA